MEEWLKKMFTLHTSNFVCRHIKDKHDHGGKNNNMQNHPCTTILQGTVKREEDKADRGGGGKTTSGKGQTWSSPSPKGQWRTEKNGCEIICGAPATLAVKGLMMMIIMASKTATNHSAEGVAPPHHGE